MKLLLFSTDDYFLNVFGEYLARKKKEYDVLSYSDMKKADDKLRSERIDLILCENGYLEDFEEEGNFISLGMHTILPKANYKAALNIYQKSDRIMEELEYLIQVLKGNNVEDKQGQKPIVSFFSTEGGSGKTTLAYLTAVLCAREKKVLYVNLEPLAFTDTLYQVEMEESMEEVLLAFDKENSTAILLDAIKRNADGVYVLPTLSNIGDYLELSVEIVFEMLHTIASMSGMEAIILDLPGSFCPLTEGIISESKSVVWVYTDGEKGRHKLQKAKEDPYLRAQGILSKSYFVLNKCKRKEDEMEYDVAFPISDSLSTANKIGKILDINPDFAKGCHKMASQVGMI